MRKTFTNKFLLVLVLFLGQFTFASDSDKETEEHGKDLKTEIKEYITHHLQDSHDFSLFSYTAENGEHKYIGAPLPVILWDEGLKVFSSSKFHHGETLAEVDGNYYKLYHSKIYKTDAEGTINYDEDHHATNVKPIDFSITKNVVMIIITGLLMLWLFTSLAKSYAKSGSIPTGAFLITNFTGTKDYWKHQFDPLGDSLPWYGKILLYIILVPIELLGIIIKPFSLLIRLYANMQAGHIVLMSLIGLMFIFKSWLGSPLSFGLAFAISLIEVLVALLQAYIFTMLSALYFGFASEEHEHEHEAELSH